MLFQHDGCPAHGTRLVSRHLRETFRIVIAGRGGTIQWPPRSPDLTPLDYFLWGYLKDEVYNNPIPVESVEELKRRVTEACARLSPDAIRDALNRGWVARAEACIGQGGGHFEQHL